MERVKLTYSQESFKGISPESESFARDIFDLYLGTNEVSNQRGLKIKDEINKLFEEKNFILVERVILQREDKMSIRRLSLSKDYYDGGGENNTRDLVKGGLLFLFERKKKGRGKYYVKFFQKTEARIKNYVSGLEEEFNKFSLEKQEEVVSCFAGL